MNPARAARWGPWSLKPDPSHEKRRLKILLLHGFCCSPRELRPLGTLLAKRGFSGLAPLLPGHGEAAHGMRACEAEDWTEAVQLSAESLRRDGSPVLMIGHCLGGVLALATARDVRPRALVTLATPLSPFSRDLFPMTEPDQRDCDVLVNSCQSALLQEWRKLSCHQSVSSSFLDNMDAAVDLALNALDETNCPILAVQSQLDPLTETQVSGLCKESTVVWSDVPSHAPHLERGRLALNLAIADFVCQVEDLELRKF